jgi:hypothetical protein
MADKYYEYFDIDENYFPCIDDSAINAGAPWDNTYPHETFIKLLKSVESMLARTNNKRSVWIHGAYGTGKSKCAYALKKILEVPNKEVEEYWCKYEPLKNQHDLLQKLLGHKNKNIITAYRYASGGINSDRDLLFAVQNSVKSALIAQKVKYTGENTLKDSVIAWIDEPTHKDFFDKLLQKPEYGGKFTQSSADEVLSTLRKGGDIKELMDNIFYLAGREGITALTLDTDRLIAWLKDIINQNDIRIVLVWDEFSAYFKKNRGALDEFQKLAALCQDKPFYFIVVTHQTSGLILDNDPSWSIVRQRFDFSEITLPDNIAFNLINNAFNVKSAAKPVWNKLADDLNSWLATSRKAVAESAKIMDQEVIKGVMPIHPMAALILKNIASVFESNQRSMFDFIKTSNTDDVKAFQWFINNTGPEDDHPLLTVDLLWNFFYEKGRSNLTADIQAILDTYPRQQNLRLDEQAVLKTILIMQAIDQRLGSTVDLFKVTDRNLDLAFEGIPYLERPKCGALAKKLVKDGVLYKKPIGNNMEVYAAAAMAGDQAKIDKHKENLRKTTTTAKLVSEGGLAGVLNLTPALKLRFETEAGTGKLRAVTMADFTRTINGLRDKAVEKSWRFYSVIAFAKDESEQVAFRKLIKEAAQNKEYENILFIDALSTPLGVESFEEYVGYSALAMYYNGNENELSKNNNSKAKGILDTDWKNRIDDGQFIVYSYHNPEGDKYPNGQAVLGALQSEVMKRYELTFDFAKGLTESMLKLTQGLNSAKSGLTQSSSGAVAGIEKHILPTVWKADEYWKHQPTLPISKIKIHIDAVVESTFASDGQISARQIYDTLTNEFGFAPCNMSAFLAGFLLKEYAYEGNIYRYIDSQNGHESMTSKIMGDMLGNYIGTYIDASKASKYKDTYLVKMTAEEMAFYALTEKAFKLTQNQCTSPGQAAQLVRTKMQALGLPIWCLAEIDDYGVFDVIEKYMEFVPSEGKDTHNKAMELGKIAIAKPSLGDTLATFLTKENCQKGMRKFLNRFEGGRILELAREIGAEGNMLEDIHSLFNVKYSGYWDKSMGKAEIRKLLIEYGIILESNSILDTNANSLSKCFSNWRERLKFVPISWESLKAVNPSLGKSLDYMQKIYKQDDFLPVDLMNFYHELKAQGQTIRSLLGDMTKTFEKTYEPYLEGLSESDIDSVRSKLPIGIYTLSRTECNFRVKEQVEIYRKGQLKTKLLALWKEKSGAASPKKWSSDYTMPILCMVPVKEFDAAKKTFDTLSRTSPSDTEIQAAIEFLETASFLEDLGDQEKRLAAFRKETIGEYVTMLTDTAKVQEELYKKLSIDPYEWYGNPSVKQMIQRMAKNEYDAGGSDKALRKIDSMDDTTLKGYLKRLVKENMMVGMEIIESGGK